MSPLFHISQAGEKNPLPQSPWIVAWIPFISSQKIHEVALSDHHWGEAPERHVCWLKKSHEYCIPVIVNQALTKFCASKIPLVLLDFWWCQHFFMGFPMLYGFPGEPRVASAAQSHPQQHRGRALPRLPRFRVDVWARAESGEIWRDLGEIIPQIWWVHPKIWWFMGLFSWIYGNHPPNFKNSEVIPKNGDIYVFFPWIHIHLQFGEVLKSGESSPKNVPCSSAWFQSLCLGLIMEATQNRNRMSETWNPCCC